MITAALYFLANAGRAERVQVAQLFFNRTAEGSCFVWATPFAGGVSAALEKTQSETLRGLVGDVQSYVNQVVEHVGAQSDVLVFAQCVVSALSPNFKAAKLTDFPPENLGSDVMAELVHARTVAPKTAAVAV
jgi:hypothetical protein